MPQGRFLLHIGIPAAFIFLLTACKKEIVPKAFFPRSAHEAYAHSLTEAHLDQTALGIDWIKAGESALKEPIDISLPFEEEFYWNPKIAEGVGYRFFVKRGLRVEAEISFYSKDSLILFCDLFRQRGDTVFDWTHVATTDKEGHRLEFEPRRDANYVLRLQPELLRGGRFKVLIREVPSIRFPVEGKSSRSIRSFFGDPRDGGRRDHHGVDIFASRHTPVIAPSESRVTRIGEGEIGGRYIWLYDSKRSMHLYFAHLETQEIKLQATVSAGQVIGTVGNTGNAKYTPTHLHFGIYRNGPIDPYHFIAETEIEPITISGDTLLLGEMVRTKQTTFLKSAPDASSHSKDTIGQHSMMIIKALAGNSYRVSLPDGTWGYISENQIELIKDSILQEIIPEEMALLESPYQKSELMENAP